MTPRKTLLVLAASLYQLDAIRAARRLGYRVVTTDNVASNPGHALADRCYQTDTTDLAGVLEIAKKERIHGVIAPCTDVAMPAAAAVAHELGLRWPSPDAVAIACDKPSFRRFMCEHRLACPRFFELAGGNASIPADLGGGRWILKPDASSGSKGIVIVRDEEDIRRRLPDTLRFSARKRAILEEFIEGHQGTCEGILKNGAIAWSCLLDRQTVPAPFAATSGHFLPTVLSAPQQRNVVETIERAWRLLGVTDGAFDCDFVVRGDEVFLLELSPRLGGNSIAKLIAAAYDFDLVEYAVRVACNKEAALPKPGDPIPSAVVILGAAAEGALDFDVVEAERLRGEPWVRRLVLDVERGSRVAAFTDGRRRAGEAILQAPDRATLDQRAAELKARLKLRAIPDHT